MKRLASGIAVAAIGVLFAAFTKPKQESGVFYFPLNPVTGTPEFTYTYPPSSPSFMWCGAGIYYCCQAYTSFNYYEDLGYYTAAGNQISGTMQLKLF